ncbi:MAG: potassium/proton antiporter [Alcanivoracaceae bacterium]|nr:potassium/proton antiporter [Alcanivoracaceae bacterium]
MDSLNLVLLLGASLLFVGLALGSLGARLGVPSLLVFLVVGMVAGVDGAGLRFNDFETGYLVSNLALAVILLDGGLRTRLSTFRVGLKPALGLATLGVALTAALVGGFATWLMGLDWRLGLLLGGIIGSTDAAAVFNVIQGSGLRLNERVASTLEIESGLNDPMAIFITVLLVGVITVGGDPLGWATLVTLLKQFGIGAVLGAASGVLLALLLVRLRSNEGMHALLLCTAGTTVFALTNSLGGSGFLAVYVVGLVVGNRGGGVGDNVFRSMDSLAWLAQSGMFLLLGLLVTPSSLGDHALDGLLIAAFLIFVARPLAVWLCLLPFAFRWREKLFVAWTGLRGAVPIVLAMFPLLAGINETRLLFDVTFVVVLASLLFQGTSLGAVSRWLRVALPATPEPLQVVPLSGSDNRYLMQFRIEPGARALGKPLSTVGGEFAQPLLVIRGEQRLTVSEDTAVAEGDRITWLGPLREKDHLADLCQTVTPSIKRFYGDFTVRGDVPVADLALAYGVSVEPPLPDGLTVAQLFARRIGGLPVAGDILYLGGLRLRVRSVTAGQVTQVGIRLPR